MNFLLITLAKRNGLIEYGTSKFTSKFVVKLQNLKFNYPLLFSETLTFTTEYEFEQIIQKLIQFY
jgi:hypothetical protein